MLRRIFRNGVYTLNIFAALLLIISILAPYVPPGKLSIFPLLGLGLPILVVVNIFFILYWIIFKSKRVLLSLILILFIATKGIIVRQRINKGEPKLENIDASKFKLITYNVRTFNVYKRTKDDFVPEKIFSLLRKENPDFVCFQEFYSNPRRFPIHDSLMRNQRFKYSHIHYYDRKNKVNYGIATYSKYPIINKEEYLFKNSSNMFLCSDIVFKKDTFRLINCHLQSTRLSNEDKAMMEKVSLLQENASQEAVKGILSSLSTAFQKRVFQAQELAKQIESSPYPVICAGDMNDTPNSYTYQIISSLLTDSFRSKGKLWGFTYNELILPLRIDYIFYSNMFRCNSIKNKNVKYSDHEPLIGEYLIVNKINQN